MRRCGNSFGGATDTAKPSTPSPNRLKRPIVDAIPSQILQRQAQPSAKISELVLSLRGSAWQVRSCSVRLLV